MFIVLSLCFQHISDSVFPQLIYRAGLLSFFLFWFQGGEEDIVDGFGEDEFQRAPRFGGEIGRAHV